MQKKYNYNTMNPGGKMSSRNPLEMESHADLVRERQIKRLSGSKGYTGDYFDIPLDSQEYKNYKKSSLLLVSGIAVLHIGAGFVNNPGMVGFFVAMPYVAAFLSLLYFSIVRFQLPKEKDKFRLGESTLLFSRMRMAGIFLGISLAGCILGEFAFIRSAPTGEPLTLEIIFLALVVLLHSCAQPGSLGGGPKDVTPAKVIKCIPDNYSAKFTGDKFTIYFDEYIELDNILQKALLSPPTDKLPEFKVKGKTLQVQFKEELKENTTYSVYFGDAIVDITEKNPLLNFTYVFSTGDLVDSLSIRGTVINSFDLKPLESIYVMLYKDNNDTLPLDSLPLNVKPYYLKKPLLIRNKDLIQFANMAESHDKQKIHTFLINTGNPGKTEPLVNLFFDKCREYHFYKKFRNEFIPLNNECITSFLKGDAHAFFHSVKELSKFTLKHFEPMIPEPFRPLWKKGLETSLYFLKLCGSGGGGFLLGFTHEPEKAKAHFAAQQIEFIPIGE